jgi:hypothetical protein
MNRIFSLGGVVAGIILVVLGAGAIVAGAVGHSEVGDELSQEKIVGTPDMTPDAIAVEAKKAGLTNVELPTCSVAGEPVDTGPEAKCFASYMRVHALEATGGKTYAEMPRYATADGKGTNDPAAAQKDPKTGAPMDNAARTIWVNETALSTALNTSFFAQAVALFAVITGVALLLTGIGLLLLSLGVVGSAPRRRGGQRPVTAAYGG